MIHKVIKQCKSIQEEFHYFTIIAEQQATDQEKEISKKSKKGKLAGLYITVKDSICTKGIETTAGSQILEGHIPIYDATVIKRLKEQDAIILGKTIQDEFGFGTFTTSVGKQFKIPKHPLDKSRVTGGSSGGSAGITRLADFPHVSIAVSTGGSIEAPASFCGVIGFCPTYGRVSRYGLISYADSLDKIGIMAKEVKDIKPVLDVIQGHDPKDGTSLKQESKPPKQKLRIALIKESLDVDKEIKQRTLEIAKQLKADLVELPLTFKYGIPTYYIIATCEASTTLARYTGLQFTKQEDVKGKSYTDYFKEIRSKYLTKESKRRIMLGTFARSQGYREQYYIKAAKVRTLIIEEYKKLFEKYDILLSPTMPSVAPTLEQTEKLTPLQKYQTDILTVGPSLAGLPHASIPIQKQGLPFGLMAIADHLEEETLLEFIEKCQTLR